MEGSLKLKQGTNNAWFIYNDNQVLIGGHNKDVMDKVFKFLNNESICNHSKEERIGETKLCCCNICG